MLALCSNAQQSLKCSKNASIICKGLRVTNSFKGVALSSERVTKSFEQVDLFTERVTKSFTWMQIFSNGLKTVVSGILFTNGKSLEFIFLCMVACINYCLSTIVPYILTAINQSTLHCKLDILLHSQ